MKMRRSGAEDVKRSFGRKLAVSREEVKLNSQCL